MGQAAPRQRVATAKQSFSYYSYLLGYIIILAAILFVEYLWVLAPNLQSSATYFIVWIDRLYYGLLLVPLCWFIAAINQIIYVDGRKYVLSTRIFATIIALLSLFTIYHISLQNYNSIIVIGLIAALCLLSAIQLIIHTIQAAKRTKWRIIPTMLLVVFFFIVALPLPYNVVYPGLTVNMNSYAKISGGTPSGTIDGVLVFDRPAVLLDFVTARIVPSYELYKRPAKEPPIAQQYAEVLEMKQTADQVAAAIALQYVAEGKGVVLTGVKIIAVELNSPAHGVLQAGDLIDRINGEQITSTTELLQQLQQVKPGEVVDLSIRRDEEPLDLTMQTKASQDDPKKAVIGIAIDTAYELDVTREVQYENYIAHIGGPSHGAMLTLALIDQLTAGGVLKQIKVAGTGTIELDGSIGMVGGIKQKAYAVSLTDADVFFVPLAGAQIAQEAAPSLQVVAVQTIDDILQWLADAGGEKEAASIN